MLSSRIQGPVSLRLKFHDQARLGPGKIALLEAVRDTGSVTAAGASMEMSARRAWLLLDSMNRAFQTPVVVTDDVAGDAEARLTALGAALVTAYREVEQDAVSAMQRRFGEIVKALNDPPDQAPGP
jgi:molybdate transport system regulatory protein